MVFVRLLAPLLLIVYGLGFYFSESTAAPKIRSIREWTKCDGKFDDAEGAAKAFDAAKASSFILLVDCPVFIHVGSDITKPIFIDNETTVQFSKSGLFKTDNMMIPAFVIANSSNIQLLDWRVEYIGSLSANPETGGFKSNGVFVPVAGKYAPPGYFNNRTLSQWLSTHRGIIFNQSAGRVASIWHGPTSQSAMFYMIGSTSNVVVRNMSLFVSKSASGSQFIPQCFSSLSGYRSNQTVTAKTPIDANYAALPNNLSFENIDLDGYYMGWQGGYQQSSWTLIRAHRYGDLQDSSGGAVGGLDKWFSPPHLLYINHQAEEIGLVSRDLRISDVEDFGNRVGVARDLLGEKQSGYANSLKIGGINVQVDRYKSARPDGLADILDGEDMKLTNLEATYDSSFLNHIYNGLRFPGYPPGYKRLLIENLTLTDKSPVTKVNPVSNATQPGNDQITLKNVNVIMNKWGGGGVAPPQPTFSGSGNTIEIRYKILN